MGKQQKKASSTRLYDFDYETKEENEIVYEAPQEEITVSQETAENSDVTVEEESDATAEDVQEAVKNLTSGGLIKVPGASNENESIYRRVAKFLVIIGIIAIILICYFISSKINKKRSKKNRKVKHYRNL